MSDFVREPTIEGTLEVVDFLYNSIEGPCGPKLDRIEDTTRELLVSQLEPHAKQIGQVVLLDSQTRVAELKALNTALAREFVFLGPSPDPDFTGFSIWELQ